MQKILVRDLVFTLNRSENPIACEPDVEQKCTSENERERVDGAKIDGAKTNTNQSSNLPAARGPAFIGGRLGRKVFGAHAG